MKRAQFRGSHILAQAQLIRLCFVAAFRSETFSTPPPSPEALAWNELRGLFRVDLGVWVYGRKLV